ncbi:hypothetical protein [Helicobacter ailurogastricus]|uniref:hypothetical protein n=1 Tax=Helicobacter ailurogastricus TaxID=1578720 RepID=UPI002490B25A|nr:hypothetical protein [Helicobacter ailurogastricus]
MADRITKVFAHGAFTKGLHNLIFDEGYGMIDGNIVIINEAENGLNLSTQIVLFLG